MARKGDRKYTEPCPSDGRIHGRRSGYNRGCRGTSCIEAHLAYQQEWRDRRVPREDRRKTRHLGSGLTSEQRRREWYLRTKYNKDSAWYEETLRAQGGGCAICHQVAVGWLRVDHDHACCSGETSCGDCVRGLLCHRCNVRLAPLDDPQWMIRAQEYLRHRPTRDWLYGEEI